MYKCLEFADIPLYHSMEWHADLHASGVAPIRATGFFGSTFEPIYYIPIIITLNIVRWNGR